MPEEGGGDVRRHGSPCALSGSQKWRGIKPLCRSIGLGNTVAAPWQGPGGASTPCEPQRRRERLARRARPTVWKAKTGAAPFLEPLCRRPSVFQPHGRAEARPSRGARRGEGRASARPQRETTTACRHRSENPGWLWKRTGATGVAPGWEGGFWVGATRCPRRSPSGGGVRGSSGFVRGRIRRRRRWEAISGRRGAWP